MRPIIHAFFNNKPFYLNVNAVKVGVERNEPFNNFIKEVTIIR